MATERNITVKEVALKAGFKDPDYFSWAFKKHTGCKPEKFRLISD